MLYFLDLRQELVEEMKAMVDTFNGNIRTIKQNMQSRHEKERKRLLLSYRTRPSGKYASSVVLTEQLDNPYFDPQPDEQTSDHGNPDTEC